ncbi:MAG: hypothetical protein U0Z44_09510 [Kouleothrix sp.]
MSRAQLAQRLRVGEDVLHTPAAGAGSSCSRSPARRRRGTSQAGQPLGVERQRQRPAVLATARPA